MRAGIAFRLASEHAELWLTGALAAIAFLGWLPFILAVVPLPSVGDLAFFAASIALAPSFPTNAVLLGGAVALVATSASVLVATGEAVLLRSIDRLRGIEPGGRSIDEEAARLWVIQLIAALPALAASIGLAAVVARVAPGEYQSPDLAGGPFLVRLARDVWPLLVLQLAALVVGQALGAGAQRASIGRGNASVRRALLVGLRGLRRHPARRLAIALATDLALVAWLAASWALLWVLWTPIARQAGGGLLTSAGVLLLVGFVAIWLCLVVGAGALHAWSSTWWSLEVDTPQSGQRSEEGGQRWT